MRAVRAATIAAALILGASHGATAQVYLGGSDNPGRGSVELSGGGMWSPGFDTGRSIAQLTRSGTDADPFDLFTTDGEVNGFPGLHARLGVYLSSAISIEGGVRYAKPELAYRLSGDAESAPDTTATETISHYVFDGSILFHLNAVSFASGRGVPFISGGGGYLRELHAGNELVETGDEVHVTGGIKYWFGDGRRIGLRAEAGVSSRRNGFDKTTERRTLPLVLAGISVVF